MNARDHEAQRRRDQAGTSIESIGAHGTPADLADWETSPLRNTPTPIGFLTGLAILEKRIADALMPLGEGIEIRRFGKAHPDQDQLIESIIGTRLLVIGPDIPFDEVLILLRRIRAASTQIPVLLLREEEDPSHVREAARAGAQAYVLYPFHAGLLRQQTLRLLVRSSMAAVPIAPFMTRIHTVEETAPLERAASIMTEQDVTGCLVVNMSGMAVGFISVKDILLAYRLRGPQAAFMPVQRFMHHKVISLDPKATLDDAIDLCVRHGLHVIPVIAAGKPHGQIVRREILRRMVAAEAENGGEAAR